MNKKNVSNSNGILYNKAELAGEGSLEACKNADSCA